MAKGLGVLGLFLLGACNQVMYQISDEHLEHLRLRVQGDLGKEYRVEVVDDLWVVASNAEEEQVRKAVQTLHDFTQCLCVRYFDRRPDRAIRVYLFKDRDSYQDYCDRTYDNPPRTPFGFYMPHERKIVVNLNTGQGTLAHELVHPLMEADFPRSPAWFNEGFASLFEHSKVHGDGRIEGLINWRIRSLKNALGRAQPPSIMDIMALDKDDFYSTNAGLNYAIARFLCLYLQEKGLMVRFYKEFRDNPRKDRSGLETLEIVTGRKLADLEPEWRQWVRALADE